MKHVVDKFHHKLPKDELKKFAREVNKKLVASDYKNRRVEDPTSISSKQAKKVRKYAQDFFERAVVKYTDHEKKKAHGGAGKPGVDAGTPSQPGEAPSAATTPIEGDISPSSSPGGRKRKRDAADADDDRADSPEAPPSETPSVKRIKEDDDAVEGEEDHHLSPPTPPPPPPPVDTPPTEEERSMREQEEALMRENEEAQRLEDEALANHHEGGRNGLTGLVNGAGSEMDVDVDMTQQQQAQKQAVLSH